MKRLLVMALVSCALIGCSLGPKYSRPEVKSPENYRNPTGPATPESVADVPWWVVFQDKVLQDLIREAIANNYDLKTATSRVEEFRARAGIAKSFLYPTVNGTFNYQATQGSQNTLPPQVGDDRTSQSWNYGFTLSWELDLFGRIRHEHESALAQFLATDQARTGVLITLVGDVAQAYFTLRGLDLELEIAHHTLEINDETLAYYKNRLEGGVSNKLEVNQAEANRAITAATIPDIERQIVQQENLISVLLGRNPGPIIRGTALEDAYVPPQIPSGIPSTLLERRPDIKEAEELLISSNADVGAAKALFFPTINLAGFFGGSSHDLGDLFNGKSTVSSIGAGLFQPIFQGGRIKQNYEAQKALFEQAVSQYHQVILNSFREVDDSLIAIQKLKEVQVEQEKEVAARQDNATLSRSRYDAGLASYLEVLLNDQDLFTVQLSLARTRVAYLNAFVQLYRALGGGWQPEQATQPPQPQSQPSS